MLFTPPAQNASSFDAIKTINPQTSKELVPAGEINFRGIYPELLKLDVKSAGASASVPFFPFIMAPYGAEGWYDILAYQALLYYRMVAPLNTAVDIVADEFANIKPHVYDTKAKKFIEHDVDELLNRPFGDMVWREFAKQAAAYLLVTGNNYTMLSGNVKEPPLEMTNIYPSLITIMPSEQDGYNGEYIYTSTYRTQRFVRDAFLYPRQFRFVNAGGDHEVWQIKLFNSRFLDGYGQYGGSKLTPIFYEIEQHLLSSIHNRGILKNGGSPSMIFAFKNNLTEDQRERLQGQIRAKYQGANNAGRIILTEADMDAKPFGITNKDMDFIELRKDLSFAIFNALKVPLALISGDHSTMSNLENSVLLLYDRAVIPLAQRMFEEYTALLMPRYKGSENLVITFQQDEITALEPRKLQQVAQKVAMNCLKTNEIRSMIGYENIPDGDDVMVPSTSVPLSALIEDPTMDSGSGSSDSYDETAKRLTFADGTPLFKK